MKWHRVWFASLNSIMDFALELQPTNTTATTFSPAFYFTTYTHEIYSNFRWNRSFCFTIFGYSFKHFNRFTFNECKTTHIELKHPNILNSRRVCMTFWKEKTSVKNMCGMKAAKEKYREEKKTHDEFNEWMTECDVLVHHHYYI